MNTERRPFEPRLFIWVAGPGLALRPVQGTWDLRTTSPTDYVRNKANAADRLICGVLFIAYGFQGPESVGL